LNTQEDIKKIITDFEKEFQVEQWCIGGIDLWPLIRNKLYIHFLSTINRKSNKSQHIDTVQIATKNTLFFYIKKGLSSVWVLLKLFFNLKPKKLVFFGSHFHRVQHKGKMFNRFFDSMVDYHSLHSLVYMFEYNGIKGQLYNPNAVVDIDKILNAYRNILKLRTRIFNPKKRKAEIQLNGYEDFLNRIETYGVNAESLRLTTRHLEQWVEKLLSMSVFFKMIFKRINPQKIVFGGYFGLDTLHASMIAANAMGIKTVEMQHGPQTNVHLSYSTWTKFPKNKPYNTLPMEFWNWDLPSKLGIDAWAIKSNGVSAKLVGQPFLGYTSSEAENSKVEKYILYSLQTAPVFDFQDMLSPAIISVIKGLNFKWVLRLHPRNNIPMDIMLSLIEEHNISEKVTIQSSKEINLSLSLQSSLLHITNFSGCLIEAKLIGVPTLLIHTLGKEMFKDYIDQKEVFYLDQSKSNFLNDFDKIIEICNKKNVESKDVLKVYNPL